MRTIQESVKPSKSILLAVFMIAFGILGYEVALMRIYAVCSFSTFGYMILSVTMLGFACAGTLIASFERFFLRYAERSLAISAMLAIPAVGMAYAISARIPFSPPLLLARGQEQIPYLLLTYITMAAPFAICAFFLGLVLTQYASLIHLTYFSDLLGSGLGAIVILIVMFFLKANHLPLFVSACFLMSALAFFMTLKHRIRWMAAGAILFVLGCWLIMRTPLRISEYKSISYALQIPDARITKDFPSPYGEIQVVDSPVERTAPGLSEQAGESEPVPVQLGVYVDGNRIGSIPGNGEKQDLTYYEYMLSSIPLQIVRDPNTLILGLGGGDTLAQVLHFSPRDVTVVEMNPGLIRMIEPEFSAYTPPVRIVWDEARGFLSRTALNHYDLAIINTLDTSGLSFATIGSIGSNFLLTQEAITTICQTLTDSGILSVMMRLSDPDRTAIRLLPMAKNALQELQIPDSEIGNHIAFIRSTFYGLLLLKKSPWNAVEMASIREISERLNFDVSWLPDYPDDLKNRFLELEWDYYDACCRALFREKTDDAAGFFRNYPFNIEPPVDDKPFFSFTWNRNTADWVEQEVHSVNPLIEWYKEIPPDLWGYPLLYVTLGQTIILAGLILLIPLFRRKRTDGISRRHPVAGIITVCIYFFALGLGYMAIEMVLIEKLTFILGDPVISASLVLAIMLICSGIGAYFSGRVQEEPGKAAMVFSVLVVLALGGYVLLLDPILHASIRYPLPLRAVIAFLLLAPLAGAMGNLFPLGIRHIAQQGSGFVPWAWALNGAASVLGATLSNLISITGGFRMTLAFGLMVYLIAGVAVGINRLIRKNQGEMEPI